MLIYLNFEYFLTSSARDSCISCLMHIFRLLAYGLSGYSVIQRSQPQGANQGGLPPAGHPQLPRSRQPPNRYYRCAATTPPSDVDS